MFKENEFIKYMMPLDADYSYGVIQELKKGRAVVLRKSYPHEGLVEVPYKFMEHMKRGDEVGCSKSKDYK